MTEAPAKDADFEAITEKFSGYYDRSLPEAEMADLARRIESDAEVRAAYQDFVGTMEALSGLHKMSRPQDFGRQVEDTIHQRSAGRFFGRRAFGDRIPLEILAAVALLLALGLYVLLRQSATGSLKLPAGDPTPEIHERAGDVVPRP